MSTPFVPCPDCKRHVLASETACPFCRSALPANVGRPRRPTTVASGPFARAAIVFMGAATTACSSSSSTGGSMPVGPAVVDASMQDDSGEPIPVVFYGPAIFDGSLLEKDAGAPGPGSDAGSDAADAEPQGDASTDAGSDAGADAGTDAGSDTDADANSGVPLPFYGPAIVDSGSGR